VLIRSTPNAPVASVDDMTKTSEGKKVRNLLKIEELTDEMKDAIDQLHDIANPKRRLDRGSGN